MSRPADSKVMFTLQGSERPRCVEELDQELPFAVGTIRKSLTRLYRTGRLWRGRGKRWWWGGPTVAWWWVASKAEDAELGQIYEVTR